MGLLNITEDLVLGGVKSLDQAYRETKGAFTSAKSNFASVRNNLEDVYKEYAPCAKEVLITGRAKAEDIYEAGSARAQEVFEQGKAKAGDFYERSKEAYDDARLRSRVRKYTPSDNADDYIDVTAEPTGGAASSAFTKNRPGAGTSH
ncbi:hypothetical protein [Sporomusa malonica]|uniref:Uncharacterized protein n=1 Tax=Sporomusa malonica TaxID=112901 RepID=A0A1W1Z6E6_9FIRM|nr:hypothetical protein [Sporomusa malonica]SMC44057.1 hypothetical protein SAMN04488500_10337 [Sporomusa malonica]